MGPKKKGKTNKLARMSEEEKLRYLQHRAAVEEEAKRRKEQLISNFMKNKLKHEESFTRLNMAKINQQWRQTLRQIKCKELHDATMTLREAFEVAMETKNKIIESLLSDLQEAESQHLKAINTHFKAVGYIIGLQSQRLDNLTKNYKTLHSERLTNAQKQLSEAHEKFENDSKELQKIIQKEKVEYNEEVEGVEDALDEYRRDIICEITAFADADEEESRETIHGLWMEMHKTMEEYKASVNTLEPEYSNLMQADQENNRQINANEKVINKLRMMISSLSKKNESYDITHQVNVNLLKKDIEEKKIEMKAIRKFLANECTQGDIKIKHLSMHSNLALQHLKKWAEKGKMLQYQYENCQKFLSDNEKLSISTYQDEEEDETGAASHLKVLENFWAAYSKVHLEVKSLSVYHSNYTEENNQLQKLLKHYMNTIGRPSSVPAMINSTQKK